MSLGAYLASEDSAVLREALGEYSGYSCLEIGAGNGGNLKELRKRFKLVVGTDLVRPGILDWSDAGANYVIADAASCFKRGSFELVVFNPPYVPSEGIVDRAVDGGTGGVEVARHFVMEALDVVKSDGRVLFLLSSANPPDCLEEFACRGFAVKKVAEKRIFYESLCVFEASADDGATEVGRGGERGWGASDCPGRERSAELCA